jgi:hypothetical protein
MGENRNVYQVLVENPEGMRPFGRPSHRGVNMLDFKHWDGKMWNGLIWLRIGQVAVFCVHGNESSASIKFQGFS